MTTVVEDQRPDLRVSEGVASSGPISIGPAFTRLIGAAPATYG